jgi:hypothetical protein
MRLNRIIAACFFLQGALPVMLFGLFHPMGVLLLLSALTYAAIGWGIWNSRIWALMGGVALTLPQLVILSSGPLSWQFYVGGSIGFGVAPSWSLIDVRLCTFFSYGVRFDFAIFERSRSLMAAYPFIRSESFVLVNVYAAFLLTSLLSVLKKGNRQLAGPPALTDGLAENRTGAESWNN